MGNGEWGMGNERHPAWSFIPHSPFALPHCDGWPISWASLMVASLARSRAAISPILSAVSFPTCRARACSPSRTSRTRHAAPCRSSSIGPPGGRTRCATAASTPPDDDRADPWQDDIRQHGAKGDADADAGRRYFPGFRARIGGRRLDVLGCRVGNHETDLVRSEPALTQLLGGVFRVGKILKNAHRCIPICCVHCIPYEIAWRITSQTPTATPRLRVHSWKPRYNDCPGGRRIVPRANREAGFGVLW
jgi:hypothetical protein